jgi:hypothetical protein
MPKNTSAPRTTRTNMWRDPVSYVTLFLVALMTITLIAWRIWRKASWGQMSLTLIILVMSLGLLVVLCLRRRTVSERKLRRRIAHCIGHPVDKMHWSGIAEELPSGHGGWTNVRCLQAHGGQFEMQNTLPLKATPLSSFPALIVRDNKGRLHLFRFSDAVPLEGIQPPTDAVFLQLIDHGIVGPDSFERSMYK